MNCLSLLCVVSILGQSLGTLRILSNQEPLPVYTSLSIDPCRIYDGEEHPSIKEVCCCLSCKQYCGATDCEKGAGGRDHCCASAIKEHAHTCSNTSFAPCLLPPTPPSPPPTPATPTPAPPTSPPTPAPPGPAPPSSLGFFDDFSTKNTSRWNYANYSRSTQGGGDTFYIGNHSTADANLTNGEGRGLRMDMSDIPCKYNTALCMGAAMATAHLSTTVAHTYGDFELRMRAPHATGSNPTICDSGIYGYFTAGYVGHPKWNEVRIPSTRTNGSPLDA